MGAAAIIALLQVLLPLLPLVAQQITTVISEIENKGLTKDTAAQVHALVAVMHQAVVDQENARLNPPAGGTP